MLLPIPLRGLAIVGAVCGVVALSTVPFSQAADAGKKPTTAPADDKTATSQVKVDLNQAIAVTMPEIKADLQAEAFTTKDGKGGWAIRLPGNRPVATPAYADGMIFVGGGYGSHEFYAFSADSGKMVWQMKTSDDGPTAAVVEDGYVAFNTESCTVIVADARTGKLIWQEWLGDPLMSQPAISKGRLFMAYPGGNPRGVEQQGKAVQQDVPAAQNGPQQQNVVPPPGNQNVQPAPPQAPAIVAPPAQAAGAAQHVGPAKLNGHRLLCADLATGKHIWEQDITADVISAPIVEGDQVFLTCFDGTSFCLNAKDGSIVWKKQNGGTSAPVIADGKVIVTEKTVKGDRVEEGFRRLDAGGGGALDPGIVAGNKAEYLKKGKEGNVALNPTAQAKQDASVGFSSTPASADLPSAGLNVNVTTVVAGWAYQGAKAAFANGQFLNAQGNHFNCVRGDTGKVAWQAEVTGKDANADAQMFAPPALGALNLYVCSAQGYLMSLRQTDGHLGFAYSTGQPMAFQPALAHGNVYAATTNGMIICLKTGEKDADGWTAWGGNAAHNKTAAAKKSDGMGGTPKAESPQSK